MAKSYDTIQGFQVTPGRPLGEFSNESGPGAGDGTPILANQVNEIRAFLAAILRATNPSATLNNLEENTVSQTAGDRQYFDGLTAYANALIQAASSTIADASKIAKRSVLGELRASVVMASVDSYLSGGSADSKTIVPNMDFILRTIPVGTILPFGSATVPAGWFECDGAEISRTSYPLLFAAIGTTWGAGDGSTTFTLPDLRFRCLFGEYVSAPVTTQKISFDSVSGLSGINPFPVGSYDDTDAGVLSYRFSASVKFIIRAL